MAGSPGHCDPSTGAITRGETARRRPSFAPSPAAAPNRAGLLASGARPGARPGETREGCSLRRVPPLRYLPSDLGHSSKRVDQSFRLLICIPPNPRAIREQCTKLRLASVDLGHTAQPVCIAVQLCETSDRRTKRLCTRITNGRPLLRIRRTTLCTFLYAIIDVIFGLPGNLIVRTVQQRPTVVLT